MSLCGGADGHLLVHGGSSPGCHRHASRLPLPHFGNSSIQESVHSVLSGDEFPLPQWSFDGVVHRGVGLASQDRPQGPQYCWAAAGQVSRGADSVMDGLWPFIISSTNLSGCRQRALILATLELTPLAAQTVHNIPSPCYICGNAFPVG